MRQGITFLLLFVLFQIKGQAQNPASVSVKKFKPPVVTPYLGHLSPSNAFCTAEIGKQLIHQPLRVMDNQKNNYTIAHYELAYTRMAMTEDELTGKASPTKDMVGRRFEEVPLPELWQKNISETLQKGETLYFFDIYCYDKQGRLFLTPSLKIEIQ